ncbi:hypothetical protein [Limnobacter sp.]|uniref:hypothetical protein n=1 Tax=Limnobacter sp. TaxID=2003368 RepID=UPI003512D0F7
MRKAMDWVVALGVALLLAACGGGGGDGASSGSSGNTGPSENAAITGLGAATVGELVRFGVNAARTEYAYEIVESEFGLAGTRRTGTLTDNRDGTYTPSGAPETRVVIFENGLILGFIKENINGTTRVFSTLVSASAAQSANELDGIYVYGGTRCIPNQGCGQAVGTLRLQGGMAEICPDEDFSSACPNKETLSVNNLGGGLFQMIRAGVDSGRFTSFVQNGRKAIIVDAKDFRTNGIGRGAYLLVQQTNQVPGAIDGDYLSFGFTGNTRFIAGVRIRGSQVAVRTVRDNGQRSEGTGTLEYNFQANGLTLVRDSGGNAVAVAVAGQGLYVALSQDSFELGLKVPNRDTVTAIQ